MSKSNGNGHASGVKLLVSKEEIEATKAKHPELQRQKLAKPKDGTAHVQQLPGLNRHPRWRAGGANVVQRDGLHYLHLTLDGQSMSIPNEQKVLAWLQASLLAFQKGVTTEPKVVEIPIKAPVE